jgi:Tol biopolymer transport system component
MIRCTWITAGCGSWSPTGEWIAYNLVPDLPVRGDDPSAPEGPHSVSELWLVHPDGSERHRLAVIDGSGSTPRWSPDGTRLASALTNDHRILIADIAHGTE